MRSALRFALVAVVLLGTAPACSTAPAPQRAPSAEAMASVREGMTMEQVEAALGKPTDVDTYGKGAETVWSWRVGGAGPSAVWFNVHFRDGKVTRTSRSVDYIG
ncbi:MAG TPA: outer membrane protein assembly factor BamE [Burkholderiales bacterium]|nr:outer membrane protein assembly factor BamE [Burkholderiales bacterium]